MTYKLIQLQHPIGYQEGLDVQAKLFDLVDKQIYDGFLVILEHTPVLTMGIRTDQSNLLVSEEYLDDQGVELFHTDRGGDITFHGPGQIVAYPIIRFRDFGLKLSEYMHRLEEVVIRTLKQYDIDATSKVEFPGVWVNNTKICAIGVRAKKFIVYHGLAFNVNVNKEFFQLINPCGITDYEISSMSDYVDSPNIETVKQTLIDEFNQVFGVSFEPISLETLQ